MFSLFLFTLKKISFCSNFRLINNLFNEKGCVIVIAIAIVVLKIKLKHTPIHKKKKKKT